MTFGFHADEPEAQALLAKLFDRMEAAGVMDARAVNLMAGYDDDPREPIFYMSFVDEEGDDAHIRLTADLVMTLHAAMTDALQSLHQRIAENN